MVHAGLRCPQGNTTFTNLKFSWFGAGDSLERLCTVSILSFPLLLLEKPRCYRGSCCWSLRSQQACSATRHLVARFFSLPPADAVQWCSSFIEPQRRQLVRRSSQLVTLLCFSAGAQQSIRTRASVPGPDCQEPLAMEVIFFILTLPYRFVWRLVLSSPFRGLIIEIWRYWSIEAVYFEILLDLKYSWISL